MASLLNTSAYLKLLSNYISSVPQRVKGTSKMRLVAYALSAACGCAPVGYSYYQRSYYTPATAYVEPAGCGYDPCGRSVSEWGGETALATGYSYGYQPYYSPYYVGSTYNSYGYPYHRPRVRIQIEAKNRPAARPAARVQLAARHHGPGSSAKVKLASAP